MNSELRKLSAADVREIGEALFGETWQSEMASSIGVPRQSVSYYMRNGGANGAQAAAIIGLIARAAMEDQASAQAQQQAHTIRQGVLKALLARFSI
jgi:predicted XRE-type DNA-binding protein